MDSKLACKKAIHLIGGPANVGKLFKPPITSQAISQWRIVPPGRVLAIEAATNSKITRNQLRPDIFGSKKGATS